MYSNYASLHCFYSLKLICKNSWLYQTVSLSIIACDTGQLLTVRVIVDMQYIEHRCIIFML